MYVSEAPAIARELSGCSYASMGVRYTLYSCNNPSEIGEWAYSLSVQPGLNGEKCQLFDGCSVQDCIDKLADAVQTRDRGEVESQADCPIE